MSAPNLTEEEEMLNIPELGDILTVKSTVFGKISGKIIYRDENLIRVLPFNSSDRAYDLPMDPNEGDFKADIGVTECIIHTKRDAPQFALQLSASPGEMLEFFNNAGQVVAPPGIIADKGINEENDTILLTDGRLLNFMYIGPPMPIQVIRVSVPAQPGEEEGVGMEQEDGDEPPDVYDLSFLEGLVPAAIMEDIPTADRTYPEVIQREEMYLDLLKSFSEARQQNPLLLRAIARETELLIALKNAAMVTSETGEIRPFTKSAESLKDIIGSIRAPLSSLLPVIAMKRILYTDVESGNETTEATLEQVDLRDGLTNELRILRAYESYLNGQEAGGAAQVSILMYSYLNDVLSRDGSVFLPNKTSLEGEEIQVDQDVLRTTLPPEPVLGYSRISTLAKEIDNSYIGEITSRHHRVIGPYKTKTQQVVAPGDPGTATNYLLFPASVGSSYRPGKSSGSIAEDIRAAAVVSSLPSIEMVTNNKRSYGEHGVRIVKGLTVVDSEGVDATEIKIVPWLADNLRSSVHPSDLLSIASVGVYRVLDSIGLRSYEWSPEVADTLWKAVRNSQQIYTSQFDAYSKTVDAYLASAKPYSFGRVIPDDSVLYKKSMEVAEIAAILRSIGEKEDIFIAQTLLNSYGGTLARLLYLASAKKHPHLKQVLRTFLSEVNRQKIKFSKEHGELAQYKAAPIINTCPHVRDMDVLRSVMKTDNPKFMAVLQKVLTRYQGGRSNNWVDCKVCNGHLICIHEVMMLYERTHPGRATALHKEILLDYGGAAFSGKYVCRFCGIAISEFEYDTHLEFDDEGRPLIGRNILEEDERTVEDELDSILNVSTKKKAIAFENPVQAELYEMTRVMVQNAGFVFEEEHYRNIVTFVYNFISTQLPPEASYLQMIAKKKVRPTYKSFVSTNQVAITAAYILCLIHTMDPPPEILFPFGGCVFRRGGYPIENDDNTDLGCMEYFVCFIANLNRDSEPWNLCMWSTESAPEKRKNIVREWILNMLSNKDMNILKSQARTFYTQNIKEAQGKASGKDRIPASFRPTPNSKPAHFDSEVMVHPDRIVDSAMKEELVKVMGIVSDREYQLACGSIVNAHLEAQKSGHISESSIRSDSMCCFSPIQNVKMGVMSVFNSEDVEQELAALHLAENIIRKRDPCNQSNGAHLYVHWSSPEAIAPTPVKPDASYFKLFMRTCFTGIRHGSEHEFGKPGKYYECRNCHFKMTVDPLVLMSDLNDEELHNNDSKRKGPPITKSQDIARLALNQNGITINSESFKELLGVVRSKRSVEPFTEPDAVSSNDVFTELDQLVNTECPFVKERISVDWTSIVKIMKANFARKAEPTESTRVIAWAPFVAHYDSIRQRIVDILDNGKGRAIPKHIQDVIDSIDRITSEPLYQGPNEVMKHWVVGLERLAQGFSEMVFGAGTWFGQNVGNAKKIQNYLFNGTKWFGKKLSQKHASKFETMIQNVLGATGDANKELNRPAIRKKSSDITHQMSTYLGRILNFWTKSMSTFAVYGVTNEEIQYILRWLIFSSIEAVLTTNSPLYSSIPKDSEKNQIQVILNKWTQSTFIEARRQFNLFGLTAEEIQMAILDAREKEKNSIIKEIEDEKDPDLQAIMKVEKKLKIGRWAIGTAKNTTTYNAEFQDFLQEQRDRAGIVETGLTKPKREDALGFDMGKIEDSAYETGQAEHEDHDGGEE